MASPPTMGRPCTGSNFAAAQGDPEAETRIGVVYQKGLGVAVDYAQAMHWFQLAADQGYAEAENNLGYLFQHGLGSGVDLTRARHWYELAAAQGNAAARDSLQVMNIDRADLVPTD